jgi:hypothetical protein
MLLPVGAAVLLLVSLSQVLLLALGHTPPHLPGSGGDEPQVRDALARGE